MILSFPTTEIPSAAVFITVVTENGQQFTAIRRHSDGVWLNSLSGEVVEVESVSGLAYVTNDALDRSAIIPQH